MQHSRLDALISLAPPCAPIMLLFVHGFWSRDAFISSLFTPGIARMVRCMQACHSHECQRYNFQAG
jgi:hypothetical protein